MRILCLLSLSLRTPVALAAPSIEVVDNGGGHATLNVITDAPGALGAEIALELSAGLTLVDATVNETLFDTPNPGDNPYLAGSPVGGDTTGLWISTDLSALFASFGSGDLGVGTFELLSFDYTGNGDATASGVVAQNGERGMNLQLVVSFGPVIDIPGDFDGNGSSGDGDLTLLLRDWGKAVPPVPPGWIGVQPTAPSIGDDELTALLSSWGQRSARTVPETGAIALLLMASAIGLLRRCR